MATPTSEKLSGSDYSYDPAEANTACNPLNGSAELGVVAFDGVGAPLEFGTVASSPTFEATTPQTKVSETCHSCVTCHNTCKADECNP